MAYTKAGCKAVNRYNAKNYEQIPLRVKKGQRAQIKAYAEQKGLSLNGYLYGLIEYDMGDALRDDSKDQQPEP